VQEVQPLKDVIAHLQSRFDDNAHSLKEWENIITSTRLMQSQISMALFTLKREQEKMMKGDRGFCQWCKQDLPY